MEALPLSQVAHFRVDLVSLAFYLGFVLKVLSLFGVIYHLKQVHLTKGEPGR